MEVLAKEIGMSRTGLSRSFSNNSLKVEALEKIAEVLGVSPCYFFEGEKLKAQEAKFEYLKNEILGSSGISFDVYNYLEKEFAAKASLSKEFIKLLNENFNNEERKGILSRGIPDKKQFDDYRQGFNVWFLMTIRDAVVSKGEPTLTEAYLVEIKASFMQLVDLAMKDEKLMFLYKEGLIGSKAFLSLLANHISIILELKIDTPVIKFLEAYFSPSDIYEALNYLMPKRK